MHIILKHMLNNLLCHHGIEASSFLCVTFEYSMGDFCGLVLKQWHSALFWRTDNLYLVISFVCFFLFLSYFDIGQIGPPLHPGEFAELPGTTRVLIFTQYSYRLPDVCTNTYETHTRRWSLPIWFYIYIYSRMHFDID